MDLKATRKKVDQIERRYAATERLKNADTNDLFHTIWALMDRVKELECKFMERVVDDARRHEALERHYCYDPNCNCVLCAVAEE
jgi:3-dehydroquinate dehydratase